MKTSLPFNNFSSGQIDRELKGRVDIPLYQHGAEISENFCQTIKGDTFYRTGFKFISEIGDASLYEFKFNQEQSYLLVFKIEYIEFWSYNLNGEFVQVLNDDGTPLKVTHPYGTEVKNLCMAQNCDVMYITHLYGNYPEMQLKRKASNKFVLEETKFTNTGTASLSNNPSTNHGCPCTCSFYENRLDRCSSSKYYTYLYGSKGADYNNITVGANTNDGFQFDLAESNSKALWLISGANSLLVGTAEGVLTINGGSTTAAITPTDITAKLSCRDGCGAVQPVRKDNYVFYVSANGRKLFMFEYDVLLEQFKSTNLSKANYEITKGGITKLVYKNDQYDFMYGVCNGKLLQICFSNDESVNAWSVIKTKGEFKDACSITRPDGNFDLFVKVKREINGITRYYLEQLTDVVEFPRFEDFISEIPKNATDSDILNLENEDKYAFHRVVAETLRACNYLDCSIEYSGLKKTKISYNNTENTITSSADDFSQQDIGRRIWIKSITGREYGIFDIVEFVSEKIVKVRTLQKPSITTSSEWYLSATKFSGLEHLEGETVAVVGNGGYIGDFIVQNGCVDISSANVNKVGSAVIGLKYKGILKSPNLGMALQTNQTYTTMKNIYSIILKLSFSAGGKVGDSLYSLEDVQDFNPDGLFDTPPLLIDTDKEILCNGKSEKEKHYFVVQNDPLPLNIAMVIPKYTHVVN